MIGHHSRFRENDDFPLWQGPVVRKKPPFSNAHALIMHKIMRSRDAQCKHAQITKIHQITTKEQWLHFLNKYSLG